MNTLMRDAGDSYPPTMSAYGRFLKRPLDWRGYTPALGTLALAGAVHYLFASTVGLSSAGVFFLYFMSVLIASWCGYGPGLLVLSLAVAVVPFAYRQNFALSRIDRFGLAVLTLVSLITSRVSQVRRQTELGLRNMNKDLDRQVSLQTVALEHRVAELETLYGQLPVGVCYLDLTLRFVRSNTMLAAIVGKPVPAGGRFQDFLSPAIAPAVEPMLCRVFQTGEPLINAELQVPDSSDPTLFKEWMITCAPVRSEQDVLLGLQVIVQDITEKKRDQQRIREINEALRRSNEDLSQFAYIAAHDLQEPVRIVITFSQLLQRSTLGRLDPDLHAKLDYVIWGADRMRQLVSGVRSYIHVLRSTMEVGSVDLNEVLRTALSNRSDDVQNLRERVTHDQLPAIEGDSHQLQQVFTQLLGNAIKFRREDVDLRVHVTAAPHDNGWMITVQDNGQGFRKEYADRIFGIFKRLHHRSVPGSGIGLAICKAVVERHGGSIWAESQEGEGTAIFMTFRAVTNSGFANKQVH